MSMPPAQGEHRRNSGWQGDDRALRPPAPPRSSTSCPQLHVAHVPFGQSTTVVVAQWNRHEWTSGARGAARDSRSKIESPESIHEARRSTKYSRVSKTTNHLGLLASVHVSRPLERKAVHNKAFLGLGTRTQNRPVLKHTRRKPPAWDPLARSAGRRPECRRRLV